MIVICVGCIFQGIFGKFLEQLCFNSSEWKNEQIMNKSEGYCPTSYLQEISKNSIQIWIWSFTLKYSEICQISEMELFAKIVLRPAFSCIRTEYTSYTGKYGSQKALVFWHILRNMRAEFWNICKVAALRCSAK